MKRIEYWFHYLERCALGFAALSLSAVMILLVIDVVVRYFLRWPMAWAHDVISLYLTVALFFPALAATYHDDIHIKVDILQRFFSPRFRLMADLFVDGLIVIILAIVLSGFFDRLTAQYVNNRIISGVIQWRLWPVSAIVFLGLLIFWLRLVIGLARNIGLFFTWPARGDRKR